MDALFIGLRSLLRQYEPLMVVLEHSETAYHLNFVTNPAANGVPAYFGGAERTPGYVRFCLMPLLYQPELCSHISANLTKCQAGKTCFHLTSVNALSLADLERLTALAVRSLQARAWLPPG